MNTDLYEHHSLQISEGGLSCRIKYNAGHEIFKGHFPGNPIVPGVCTLQLVKDLLQQALKRKLILLHAPNVKFLQLITPAVEPLASISWSRSDAGYMASATLTDGAATLFKMNAVYSATD